MLRSVWTEGGEKGAADSERFVKRPTPYTCVLQERGNGLLTRAKPSRQVPTPESQILERWLLRNLSQLKGPD